MWIMPIRHAESEANAKHETYAKIADASIELTKKGREEALKLAQFLENFFDMNPPDGKVLLWSSDYVRAEQTAQIILENVSNVEFAYSPQSEHDHIIADERLREREFGLFSGLTAEQAHKKYPNEAAYFEMLKNDRRGNDKGTGGFYARPPMGESPADVALRLRSFYGSLSRVVNDEENGAKNHIMVTHGIPMRVTPFTFMKQHPRQYAKEKNPGNTAVRFIQRRDEMLRKVKDPGRKYDDHGYIYDPSVKIIRAEKLIHTL